VVVDLSGYARECGVEVKQQDDRLVIAWPMDEKEHGRLTLDMRPGRPLIELLGIAGGAAEEAKPLLREVEPLTFLTVGTRQAPDGRPPEMSVWNTFFDRPAGRPYRSHLARLDLRRVRVASEGRRAAITLGNVTVGPFMGELVFTLYP